MGPEVTDNAPHQATLCSHRAGTGVESELAFGSFVASDCEAAARLKKIVGWPHRLADWRFGLTHGEGVAACREGELMGTAMRWRWGERHAAVGMVIVAPPLQGKGIGRRLMNAVLSGMEDRTLLLHATLQSRALYELFGFRVTGEIRSHQGVVGPAAMMSSRPAELLRRAGHDDAELLSTLDARAAGMPRSAVIR